MDKPQLSTRDNILANIQHTNKHLEELIREIEQQNKDEGQQSERERQERGRVQAEWQNGKPMLNLLTETEQLEKLIERNKALGARLEMLLKETRNPQAVIKTENYDPLPESVAQGRSQHPATIQTVVNNDQQDNMAQNYFKQGVAGVDDQGYATPEAPDYTAQSGGQNLEQNTLHEGYQQALFVGRNARLRRSAGSILAKREGPTLLHNPSKITRIQTATEGPEDDDGMMPDITEEDLKFLIGLSGGEKDINHGESFEEGFEEGFEQDTEGFEHGEMEHSQHELKGQLLQRQAELFEELHELKNTIIVHSDSSLVICENLEIALKACFKPLNDYIEKAGINGETETKFIEVMASLLQEMEGIDK